MKKEKMIEWMTEGSISIPKMLLKGYAKLGLTEQELVLLLQVHMFSESGNAFPTPAQLADRMSLSTDKVTGMLRTLVQKGFLTLEEKVDEQFIRSETYSLYPLWEKMIYLFMEEKEEESRAEIDQQEFNLYPVFEQEFGRPLSPIEAETLSIWLDQDEHEPTLIKAALREAVISGKLNFRYIDRILFEWQKNNIRTAEEAMEFGKKFRQNQVRNKKQMSKSESGAQAAPLYNWLEQ